jgi:hypothetical protein
MGWATGFTRAVLAAAFICIATTGAFAEGRWLRAESPHFVIYGDSNEAALRDATQRLEAFDATLRILLAPPEGDVPKLDVYLFRSQGDLDHSLGVSARGIGGYYSASPGFIGAIALQNFGRADLRDFAGEVLLHEYAHHFMLSHFSNAYPAWFVEGFAEFVATTEITETEVRVGAASLFRAGILNGDWPRMDRVLKPGERGSVVGIYGVGWLATHYLVSTPERMEDFGRYLEAFQSGVDPVEAFEPAFGVTPEQFASELRRYRGSGMRGFVFPRAQTPASDISVTRLPEAANDLLPYVIQLRRIDLEDRSDREDEDERLRRIRVAIERTRNIGARFPADPYAIRAVARADLLHGSPAAARTQLQPLLTTMPDDTEALYLMGQSYLVEARAGEPAAFTQTASQGRRYFARAFRLNPADVATLYGYAETYSAEPGPMPDGPLDVLTQAYLLAPEVMRLRLRLGSELMEAGRFGEAIPVLSVAAFAPHRNPMTRQARVLLEAAQRGELATAEALAAAVPEPDDD